MTNHTQGPWHVNGFSCITNGKKTLANVTPAGEFYTYKEAEANAYLIASAPDLLEAGQEAMNYLDDLAIDLDGHDEEILAAIRLKLSEAIAKAKGE